MAVDANRSTMASSGAVPAPRLISLPLIIILSLSHALEDAWSIDVRVNTFKLLAPPNLLVIVDVDDNMMG
jgi:hypothetical protein